MLTTFMFVRTGRLCLSCVGRMLLNINAHGFSSPSCFNVLKFVICEYKLKQVLNNLFIISQLASKHGGSFYL